MSSLKKGKPSERETVETVIDVGVGIISPRLKSWVNSKLRSLITVSTVFMIFKMRSKYFNFKSFLSGLIDEKHIITFNLLKYICSCLTNLL